MVKRKETDGLKALDERIQKRKTLFRVLLFGLTAFAVFELTHTPLEFWEPKAALLGLIYAGALHSIFYLKIAPWIAGKKEVEDRERLGFRSVWVYLFFLLGPFLVPQTGLAQSWFRMGFLIGYALVFSIYGTYLEYARKTWMRS
ncbi:MAG TPA: hypothetical protein VHE12_02865 [bacterium]|nr:hypothetical protein [bacterium]